MYIDIVKIRFGIANWRISVLTVICPPHLCFSFRGNNLSKYQWIFTTLGMCIDIMGFWFGMLLNKCLAMTGLSARHWVLSFHVFFLFFVGGNDDGHFTFTQAGTIKTTTEWPVGNDKTAEITLTAQASDGESSTTADVTISYSAAIRATSAAFIIFLFTLCIYILL